MTFSARIDEFWFVRLCGRIGKGWLGGALIVALIPYVLALLLVAPFGDAGLYLRTPAFYMGFCGVMLVMAATVKGVEILGRGLSELQLVATEPSRFHGYADSQLKAAARDRSNVALLAIFFGGAVVLVVAALHRWHDSGVHHVVHGFHAFPVAWRAPDRLAPAGLALAVFAVAVAATIGTGAILLGRNLVFSWRLRTFDYMPFPGRVRLALRPLVSAYTWASATWMIGVALFALFFFQSWSGLNVVLITVLAVLGLLTLAVPYSSFRRMLDKAHDAMAEQLASRVEQMAGDGIASPAEFAAVNTAITSDPPPVLTRRGAIAYGAVQVLAVGTLFAKDAIQENVSLLAKERSSSVRKKR